MKHAGARRGAALALVPTFALWLALSSTLPAAAGGGDATLTILHGLPRFTADVYVNGKLLLDGFKPDAVTEPLKVPPGRYDVAIRSVGAPADSKPALAATVMLAAGVNYAAIAHQDGNGKPALTLFRDDVSPVSAGRARLVVRDVAHAGALDVQFGTRSLFQNLTQPDERTSLVSPGRQPLQVMDHRGTNPLATAPLTVPEGGATFVYIVGSSSDHTLDLMVQQINDLNTDPSSVGSGTGGMAAEPGFPPIVIALLAVALACALGAIRSIQSSGTRRVDRGR